MYDTPDPTPSEGKKKIILITTEEILRRNAEWGSLLPHIYRKNIFNQSWGADRLAIRRLQASTRSQRSTLEQTE